MGYVRETGIEQLVRDVRITSIYEGISQVQIAASLKLVMAEILQTYSAEKEKLLTAPELKPLLNVISEIREAFRDCLDLLKEKHGSRYNDAAAKDLVEMYGSILAGYLLITTAARSEQKLLVAYRYAKTAHADAIARRV